MERPDPLPCKPDSSVSLLWASPPPLPAQSCVSCVLSLGLSSSRCDRDGRSRPGASAGEKTDSLQETRPSPSIVPVGTLEPELGKAVDSGAAPGCRAALGPPLQPPVHAHRSSAGWKMTCCRELCARLPALAGLASSPFQYSSLECLVTVLCGGSYPVCTPGVLGPRSGVGVGAEGCISSRPS